MTDIEKDALDAVFEYSFYNPKAEYDECDLEKLYIQGAKEHSVVWHDLRENPSDMPTGKKRVLVSTKYMTHIVYYKINHFEDEDGDNIGEVIAWCEIPEFEKE